MSAEAFRYVVVVFGTAICAACIVSWWRPTRLASFVMAFAEKGWGIPVGVGVRVVLGIMLILAAPASKFPLVFQILGAVTILAGIGLPLIGKERVMRIIAWFAELPEAGMRAWLILGFAFGAFIVYGAL